tara:strand:- start:143 stop:733 length:591 start_codon:yes stop_codon:yes gene_type:complete
VLLLPFVRHKFISVSLLKITNKKQEIMTKLNFMKSVILLFAVLAFSGCEENGPIQFIAVDEFEITLPISGAQNELSFDYTSPAESSIDISELLGEASSFVELYVEELTVTLEDYSGNKIALDLEVSALGLPFDYNHSLELTSGIATSIDLKNTLDLLLFLSSTSIPVTVKGESSGILADDNFTLKLKLKIKGIVEM